MKTNLCLDRRCLLFNCCVLKFRLGDSAILELCYLIVSTIDEKSLHLKITEKILDTAKRVGLEINANKKEVYDITKKVTGSHTRARKHTWK